MCARKGPAGTVFARGERNDEVERLEKRLADAVERQLGEQVAFAPSAISAYVPGTTERLSRSEGCAAGDFAADAAWWYANGKAAMACDFALMNGGNVRADIPSGKVTLKEFRTVQPFAGALGVVEASGRQVLDALEFGAQAVGEGEFGGFLQVAGLRYSINASKRHSMRMDATGSWVAGPTNGAYRVRDVKVYDRAAGRFKPLDPDATYRVIGNAFTLVEGGDGFAMFKGAKVIENGLATDYLVLAEYAKAFGKGDDGMPRLTSEASPLAALQKYPVSYENPRGSGRIVTVTGLVR